ncbi:MAG: hypothetical protein NZM11_00970 [Anaerolineales bacterium]|nr:hypothetical protein [Anaerolineales bacterium]
MGCSVERRRFVTGCLLAATVTGCLLSMALFGLLQGWLPTARLPLGYRVVACVNAPAGQHGVVLRWLVPELSSMIVLRGPGCVWLPWLPVLPVAGSLHFPP